MLIPNHPDDERLSALASRDTDATADAKLTAHVSSCIRCTELVDELGVLRVALAELPDLQPSRQLQLVPPVEADHAVDRLGGWARRFFGPVLVSGAALFLVGVVGTAAPALNSMAGSRAQLAAPAPSAALEEAAAASSAASMRDAAAEPTASLPQEFSATSDPAAAPGGETDHGYIAGSAAAEASDDVDELNSHGGLAAAGEPGSDGTDSRQDSPDLASLESSRSPWPMVLFAGVALVVAALLMRWVLAPRAT